MLGVPLICWPFNSDQGLAASHLTTNFDVAFELTEVRTGHGLKPVHRTGKAPIGTIEALREEVINVLDQAFSEHGAKKRVNIRKLQEKLLNSWSSAGSSQRVLEAIVNAFIV